MRPRPWWRGQSRAGSAMGCGGVAKAVGALPGTVVALPRPWECGQGLRSVAKGCGGVAKAVEALPWGMGARP